MWPFKKKEVKPEPLKYESVGVYEGTVLIDDRCYRIHVKGYAKIFKHSRRTSATSCVSLFPDFIDHWKKLGMFCTKHIIEDHNLGELIKFDRVKAFYLQEEPLYVVAEEDNE